MKTQILLSLLLLAPELKADLLFDKQWAIQNTGTSIFRKDSELTRKEVKGVSGIDINWTALEDDRLEDNKKEVIVAVIDSGVDINHPDLAGRIWYNHALCDKATNAKFLDCNGKNFLDNNNDLTDEVGHGTHVAGIIAANKNDIGIMGIAHKNIKIMPLKVINDKVSGFTYNNKLITSVVAQAMMYAVKNGAEVINLSLGWPKLIDSQEVRAAFEYAKNKNVTVIAAAGNNNKDLPTFPCSYESVICVGAIDNQGVLSEFTNHGKNVDLLAPGENIISTYPTKLESRVLRFQGYEYKNGSSQAAPMVAGIVASLKLLQNDLNQDQIKNLLYSNARSLPQSDYKKFSKFGLVNMLESILSLSKTTESFMAIPLVKNLSEIAFSTIENKFEINLPIKNLSSINKANVKVCLYSESFGVRVEESCQNLSELNAYEEKVVNFKGRITDLNTDSHVLFDISIDEENFKSSFVFSRDLTNDPEVISYSLGKQNFDQMGIISAQRKLSRLNKVMDRHQQVSFPEYFFTDAKNQTPEHTVLSLVSKTSDLSGFEVKTIKLPKLNRVLSIHRADINLDSKVDYFIYALNTKKDTLEFFVLDDNLEELYAGKSHWSMKLSTFEGLPIENGKEDFQWIKVNHEIFGAMIVPSIYRRHTMPEEDNSKVMLERVNSLSFHQYYLLPELKDDKVLIKQRALDSVTVMRSIRGQLGVLGPYDYKSVYLQKPLTQTLLDIHEGVVKSVVLLEENGAVEFYEIALRSEVSSEEVSIKKIHTREALDQSLIYDVVDSQSGKILNESVFTFLLNRSKAQFVNYQDQELSADLGFKNTWDNPILSLLGAFSDNGNKKYLIENRYSVALVSETGETSQLPIYRDSSFPGQTFAESFTPILSQGKIGLFVNSTLIFGNRIYSMIDSHFQGLIRPLAFSVSIPANCVALNPEAMEDKSLHNYLFLCQESSGDVQLKLLPLSTY